jgi:hypothetical protein
MCGYQNVLGAVRDQWRHTDGGPAQNLLANWTASAIVVSVDLDAVAKGGPILAVWGKTVSPKRALDRMARPFVGNTLLGAAPFSTDAASRDLRQRYNAVTPATSAVYAAQIEKSLAMHDGLDVLDCQCGNQPLADKAADLSTRYRMLARVFADDRLWVNSAAHVCTQFFAVELAALAGHKDLGAAHAPAPDGCRSVRELQPVREGDPAGGTGGRRTAGAGDETGGLAA